MKNDIKLQIKVARLANASHFLTWCDMAKVYPWNYLICRGLLTLYEVDILKSLPTINKDALFLTWILEEIGNWQKKRSRVDSLACTMCSGLKLRWDTMENASHEMSTQFVCKAIMPVCQYISPITSFN